MKRFIQMILLLSATLWAQPGFGKAVDYYCVFNTIHLEKESESGLYLQKSKMVKQGKFKVVVSDALKDMHELYESEGLRYLVSGRTEKAASGQVLGQFVELSIADESLPYPHYFGVSIKTKLGEKLHYEDISRNVSVQCNPIK